MIQKQLNEIKRKWQRIAYLAIFAIDMIFTVLLFLSWAPHPWNTTPISPNRYGAAILLGVAIILFSTAIFAVVFNACIAQELEEQRSHLIVNEYLTDPDGVEVIPIDAIKHKALILGLTDVATYYAVSGMLGEMEVVFVVLQLQGEEKYRPVEECSTRYFTKYYKIVGVEEE